MSEEVAGFRPFQLERFFAKHEFHARFNLAASDCETVSLQELLALASPSSRELWEKLSLGYTRAEGLPQLREAIAADYDRGCPEEVLTVVPVEGIYLTLRALLDSSDEVIAPWPAYQSLYEVALACGAQLKYWKPEIAAPDSRGAHFSVDALRSLVTKKTKLIVINFPHNPTGAHLSKCDWEAVFEIAEKVGAFVLSDEMYRGLESRPEADRLPAGYEMDYERVISLSGLSKRHGLPGLRVGWLATRDQALMKKLMQLKDYTTICAAAPAEVLGLIGLEAQSHLTQRSNQFIKRGFDAWEELNSEHPGRFDWVRPMAGPISFVRLLDDQKGSDELSDYLLQDYGILILPGSVYDIAYRQYFRIGVGRSTSPAAIELFAKALHAF